MKVIIHHSSGTNRETDHYNDEYALRYIADHHSKASYWTDGKDWHVCYYQKEG